jgi:hypothetical protein
VAVNDGSKRARFVRLAPRDRHRGARGLEIRVVLVGRGDERLERDGARDVGGRVLRVHVRGWERDEGDERGEGHATRTCVTVLHVRLSLRSGRERLTDGHHGATLGGVD